MVASTGSYPVPMDELFRVVPRFVDRTSRQVEFSRVMLGHLPCVGEQMLSIGLAKRADSTEAVSPTTNGSTAVLTGTAAPTTGDDAAPSAGTTHDGPDTSSGPARGARHETTTTSIPLEKDLAIPEYDSLAASQVIPRLEMLQPSDLRLVLRYEETKRNRQTIVHKVGQLLASADDL